MCVCARALCLYVCLYVYVRKARGLKINAKLFIVYLFWDKNIITSYFLNQDFMNREVFLVLLGITLVYGIPHKVYSIARSER